MTEHGTMAMYRRGCKCEFCLAASSETARLRREFWGNPDNYDPDKTWHGSNYGYKSYGCRCEDCKAAAKQHRLEKKWTEFWR